MPRIPLTNTHSESVDVFVQLIKKRDALDDHVIDAVDVELDLAARVSVRKTELRLLKLAVLQLANELREMKPNATKELSNCVALCAGNIESFRKVRTEPLSSNNALSCMAEPSFSS